VIFLEIQKSKLLSTSSYVHTPFKRKYLPLVHQKEGATFTDFLLQDDIYNNFSNNFLSITFSHFVDSKARHCKLQAYD